MRPAAEVSVARGGVGAFEEAVSQGVSADLCEALALVRECTSVTELDLSVGWAAARPEIQKLPTRHEFTMDTLEVIGEAGRTLREEGARSTPSRLRVSSCSLESTFGRVYGHSRGCRECPRSTSPYPRRRIWRRLEDGRRRHEQATCISLPG